MGFYYWMTNLFKAIIYIVNEEWSSIMPLSPKDATVVTQALADLKKTIEKAYSDGEHGVSKKDYEEEMKAIDGKISEINVITDTPEAIGQKCRALSDSVTGLSWHAPGVPVAGKTSTGKVRKLLNTTGLALVNFTAAIANTEVKIPSRLTAPMPKRVIPPPPAFKPGTSELAAHINNLKKAAGQLCKVVPGLQFNVDDKDILLTIEQKCKALIQESEKQHGNNPSPAVSGAIAMLRNTLKETPRQALGLDAPTPAPRPTTRAGEAPKGGKVQQHVNPAQANVMNQMQDTLKGAGTSVLKNVDKSHLK